MHSKVPKTKTKEKKKVEPHIKLVSEATFTVCGFFIFLALAPVLIQKLLPPSSREQLATIEIIVDASQELGALPTVWIPGISTNGLGASITPMGKSSEETLNLWNETIGFDRGVHEVILDHWVYEAQDGVEANLEQYAEYIRDIVEAGGTPLIRMIGTPCYLSPFCTYVEGEPFEWEEGYQNYYAYAPDDLEEWQDFIYDQLKYIIVKYETPADYVNNFHLFQDNANHRPLGLGDDQLFSFWYSFWGIDPFQFRGSEQEAFELWEATFEAAKQLELDYPGADVKLGGFGFPGGNENLVVYQDIGIWDENPNDGYSGFVYDLIDYSHDPNEDGNDADRIPIDWVDYQFRHPDPFAISDPQGSNNGWHNDNRGQLETFLAEFGYNLADIPIMANAWHGQFRVNGLQDSFGRMIGGIETHSEIDAALNPARLNDMEVAGQTKHYREALQNFSSIDDPCNPLFYNGWDGGIGLFTVGFGTDNNACSEEKGWNYREGDYLGLKKAPFNSFRLIDLLGDVKLYRKSSAYTFWDGNGTVNAYATKNSVDDTVQVLVWTYVSPFRYVNQGEGDPDPNTVGYTELYNLINSELGSDHFEINLSVNNINTLNSENIKVTRYLIDKFHSNPFQFRNQICSALGIEGCVGGFPQGDYTMEEINNWTAFNNPYNASVDLEMVEETVIENPNSYNTQLSLLPYSVTLLILSPTEGEPLPDNHPPVLSEIGSQSVNEGDLLEFTVSATDVDEDLVGLTTSLLPEGASFVDHGNNTGTFSWDPNFEQANEYSITFTADDHEGGVDLETINITVNNVNQAPSLAPIGNQVVNENGNLTFTISAADLDNDPLTYSASNLPSGANFDPTTRTFSWTPNYNQVNIYNGVTFTVSDGTFSDSEVITITVNNVVSPELTASSSFVVRGSSVTLYSKITNFSSETVNVDYWVDDTRPNGSPNPKNPIVTKQTITLTAGQSQTITSVINVPQNEPVGMHTDVLKVSVVGQPSVLFGLSQINMEVRKR